ncbi:MAG: prepilin-type N-terminal cleavage/methylation domain-containing protein [Patescibacteria group bacterium]|nr:prepilin-type N-terminal cleavage/methylation domain-containing protein [Patescibacteria group bacterium]
MQYFKKQRGFTLIEILIVIGIIAVLASIVIVAINPARQFAQARNTERTSAVSTVLNAIGQDTADNEGVFGGVCSTAQSIIPATSTDIGTAAGLVDLSCLVPTYIPSALPMDPIGGTASDTQYTVAVDATGRYTVCAPKANEAALGSPGPICLTR